ncbi:hypothetical protein POVWA2_006950 [Plasmodium ovale wallikeri]|uniref:Uncharacterized protein n=1 Tax=Plasmodium ovale wallikeri TaxID=864142 RepID=A0A1A8YIJ3_PLAOA|nr:hypothetical protein POVWA1_006720 [Plasmodium ovale wallikeri]SBT31954.1 hypothetical protein POVWA2_006950 [Plasmodium ovale wallikeri]
MGDEGGEAFPNRPYAWYMLPRKGAHPTELASTPYNRYVAEKTSYVALPRSAAKRGAPIPKAYTYIYLNI